MLDFARRLTLVSALRYFRGRAVRRDYPITLTLSSGARFELRPNSAGNNDYGVAYEVFVHDYYNDRGMLPTGNIEFVVDLGVNVGFSLLYFLHKYPFCRIIGFEPHPRHFAQAERNLAIDGSRHRVELYNKAAGAKNELVSLSDRGSGSSLDATEPSTTIPVEAIDIFPVLLRRRIDLLKMDIEGGEYEILRDRRFEELALGAVVMEWHSRGAGKEDKRWCERRLQDLGFVVDEIFARQSHGMFWATRPRRGLPTS